MRHEAFSSHLENLFHGKELGSILLRHPDKKKKIPDLASTRFRIHIGFKHIHSGERIQKVADSPANSLDTCGRGLSESSSQGLFTRARVAFYPGLNHRGG